MIGLQGHSRTTSIEWSQVLRKSNPYTQSVRNSSLPSHPREPSAMKPLAPPAVVYDIPTQSKGDSNVFVWSTLTDKSKNIYIDNILPDSSTSYPKFLQATVAAVMSKPFEQTVPHCPLLQAHKRLSLSNLTCPSLQTSWLFPSGRKTDINALCKLEIVPFVKVDIISD